MKNFLEEDSYEYTDDESEEEELETEKKTISKKTKLSYDEKLAPIIVQIHRDARRKNFTKWVQKNFSDLKNLYNLSELDVSFYEFSRIMYPN